MSDDVLLGGPGGPTTLGSPDVEAMAEGSYGALRARAFPDEFLVQGFAGGHFRAAASLTATYTAGSIIFSFQWQMAGLALDSYAILKRLQIGCISTAVANQLVDVDAIVARNWTVSDTGANGSAALFAGAGNNLKARCNFHNTSQTARIAIGGGATPITAGTRTLDAFPFAATCLPRGGGIGDGALVTLYECAAMAQHPIIFGSGEGFIVRAITTTASNCRYYVAVEWAEVTGY